MVATIESTNKLQRCKGSGLDLFEQGNLACVRPVSRAQLVSWLAIRDGQLNVNLREI